MSEWFADSGETVHVMDEENDLSSCVNCEDKIRVGGGNIHIAKKKGNVMPKRME